MIRLPHSRWLIAVVEALYPIGTVFLLPLMLMESIACGLCPPFKRWLRRRRRNAYFGTR